MSDEEEYKPMTQDEVIYKLEHNQATEVSKMDIGNANVVTLHFCPRCGSKDIVPYEVNDDDEIIIDFECHKCYRIFTIKLGQANDEWVY